MFNNLLKGILSAIVGNLLVNYRQLSLQLLKIEAAKSCIHGVRIVRLSALGLMAMVLVIGLICVGVLLFHAGLFILLPGSVKAKAALGMLLGLLYVALGGVALRAATDERTWLEKSGAAAMLKEALRPSKKS